MPKLVLILKHWWYFYYSFYFISNMSTWFSHVVDKNLIHAQVSNAENKNGRFEYQFKHIVFSDMRISSKNPKGFTQINSMWTKESLLDRGSLTYLDALALEPLEPLKLLDDISARTPASSPQQSRISPAKLERSIASYLQFATEDWKAYFPEELIESAQATLVIYVIL